MSKLRIELKHMYLQQFKLFPVEMMKDWYSLVEKKVH
jgi:hypothetical protein